uniref:Uncharacterized protein n=1 Tax=Photinus pyralis TaxID=7054 RepID=A0A1Y1MFJ7_PHOPY
MSSTVSPSTTVSSSGALAVYDCQATRTSPLLGCLRVKCIVVVGGVSCSCSSVNQKIWNVVCAGANSLLISGSTLSGHFFTQFLGQILTYAFRVTSRNRLTFDVRAPKNSVEGVFFFWWGRAKRTGTNNYCTSNSKHSY